MDRRQLRLELLRLTAPGANRANGDAQGAVHQARVLEAYVLEEVQDGKREDQPPAPGKADGTEVSRATRSRQKGANLDEGKDLV